MCLFIYGFIQIVNVMLRTSKDLKYKKHGTGSPSHLNIMAVFITQGEGFTPTRCSLWPILLVSKVQSNIFGALKRAVFWSLAKAGVFVPWFEHLLGNMIS